MSCRDLNTIHLVVEHILAMNPGARAIIASESYGKTNADMIILPADCEESVVVSSKFAYPADKDGCSALGIQVPNFRIKVMDANALLIMLAEAKIYVSGNRLKEELVEHGFIMIEKPQIPLRRDEINERLIGGGFNLVYCLGSQKAK